MFSNTSPLKDEKAKAWRGHELPRGLQLATTGGGQQTHCHLTIAWVLEMASCGCLCARCECRDLCWRGWCLGIEGSRLREGDQAALPSWLLYMMLWGKTYRTQNRYLLTGIGWVGSWAIEEGWGAAQIGHGGRAVAIHACGDRVIVGLLWGGARHIPMWWHAAWVAGETWEVRAKPGMRVEFRWWHSWETWGIGEEEHFHYAPS